MKKAQGIPPLLVLLGFMAMLPLPSEASIYRPSSPLVTGADVTGCGASRTIFPRRPSFHPGRGCGKRPEVGLLPLFTNPEASDCLDPIIRTNGCAPSIDRSYFSGTIELGRECCEAVEGLPERCAGVISPDVPLEGSVVRLIKDFCASHGGDPPSPTAESRPLVFKRV